MLYIIIIINIVHEVHNKFKHKRKAKRKQKRKAKKHKTVMITLRTKCSLAAQTSSFLILLSDSTNSPSRTITNSRIRSAQHWTL